MDLANKIADDILHLTEAIEKAPSDHNLYMERGKLHQRSGSFDKALNDFIQVTELDAGNTEAEGYILILQEIFSFRYFDIYNP